MCCHAVFQVVFFDPRNTTADRVSYAIARLHTTLGTAVTTHSVPLVSAKD